jgi:hypothetical protein
MKRKPQKDEFEDNEETKNDVKMEEVEQKIKPVYHVINPELLFRPDWIQIPVKPVIRNKKTTPSYSYSYSYNNTN